MRDAAVYNLIREMNEKLALLFQQFQFVETRNQALETILKDLLKTDDLKDLIDAEHVKVLQSERARDLEAQIKAEEERRKPKLTLLNGAHR